MEIFNSSQSDFKLYEEDNRIKLKSLKHKDWLPFFIDFTSSDLTRRKNQSGLKQEIAKAIGIKKDFKPKVLDTTVGLARDSFILANLGCEMTMLERNPVIFLLLSNAIQLAEKEILSIIDKMKLINQDSIEFLKNNKKIFDVIYVDPMFPKSKKSRLVKKDMQIFREIVGDDLDNPILFNLALEQKVKRVVVKRMINSDFVNNQKPNFQIKGTTTRFDIYTSF